MAILIPSMLYRKPSFTPVSIERQRIDVDSANLRLMIITSFLVGATMILLSSNISLIRQSPTSGSAGLVEGLLIVSIALLLFSSLIMLFTSAIILVTMYLGLFTFEEKLGRIAMARTLLGLSSIWHWIRERHYPSLTEELLSQQVRAS